MISVYHWERFLAFLPFSHPLWVICLHMVGEAVKRSFMASSKISSAYLWKTD